MAYGGYKTASNTTSGKMSGGHKKKYEQSFEGSLGALDSTPYMNYEKPIMGRNQTVVNKNMANLKQD